jgi:DNA-binding MarR family transcriptional regulator
MKVNYTKRSRLVRYVCTRMPPQGSAALCQSFGALRLERAFAQWVLEALAPLGRDAMIEAAASHRRDSERERALWHPQLERARDEVDLARRQYDAVDPANRLVARELERRWEHALSVLQTLETDIEAKLGALEKPLSPQEQARLRQLAYDLPGLWEAPTTRLQDKKRLIRCLVEQVVVRVPDEQAPLQADVHWVGGEITRIEVPKGRTGIHRYVTDEEIVERVRQLAAEFSDEQIARIFHRKRLKTSKGLPFNAKRVTHLRYTHPIPGHTRTTLDNDHVYTVEQAAERLGVDRSTVVRWICSY